MSFFIYCDLPNPQLVKKSLFQSTGYSSYQDEHTNHYITSNNSFVLDRVSQSSLFVSPTDFFLKNLPLYLAFQKIAGITTRKGETITRLCGREGR